MSKKTKISGSIISTKALKNKEVLDMFELYCHYYENGKMDVFRKDLSEKDHLILLENTTGKVMGFCTLKCYHEVVDGKKIVAVYTGDTIVEKEYWGKNPLGSTFSRYLLLQSMKHPFKKVYWFLTSKGYKTYLTMAKNFQVYYPRHEEAAMPEHFQNIINLLSVKKYGNKFNRAKGLVEHTGQSDFLKGEVAPITEELKKSNPQIAFFQKVNPNWENGDELVCLSLFDLRNAINYSFKKIRKVFF